MWTASALIVTVLMGGLIAYLGDLTGRRFGKRRASIFGLRPRHTAVLITSVTGTLISMTTTAVLFLAVQPVRDVILRGEAAIRSSARLRRENAILLASNQRVRQAARDARLERQKALEEQQRALAELARTQASLANVRSAMLQAKAAEARAQQARARAEAAARAAHEQVRMERQIAVDLARRNESLKQATHELKRASEELRQRNETLRAENETLSGTNAAYSQENAALARQNESLVRDRDALTATIADLRKQQDTLAEQIRTLRAQYDDLMQGYTAAYGAHRSLWEMFESLRTRRIAIHGGEELARIVVPPNTPPDGVRGAISTLMSEANREALKKGAAPGEKARAVEIVDKRFTTPIPGGVTTTRVTEQDRVDAIVARLARSSEPVCLLAVAVANSVIGEPGAVDLQPMPNPLVYRKGQVIATRKVDATRPAGQVFDELVLMLKGLGQAALTRGLIPRLDPLTGEPQTGALSAAELVDLTARVCASRRPVEVIALAAEDVSAADSLKLEFRVRGSY